MSEEDTDAFIREADALRDAGNYAAAAGAYAKVLRYAPALTDIRVQYANMLKDSGCYPLAEEQYKSVLKEARSADTHLQYGHLLKLMGRRGEALIEYRRALNLDPLQKTAFAELIALGDHASIERRFHHETAAGSAESLLSLAIEVRNIRQQLEKIAGLLPDPLSATGFPLDCYDHLRQACDIPPPPEPVLSNQGFLVLLPVDNFPLDILYQQIEALASQGYKNWKAIFFGSGEAYRCIIERAAQVDSRLTWVELPDREALPTLELGLAQETNYSRILFTEPGGVLHTHALAWIASSFDSHSCAGYVFDSEVTASEQFRKIYLRPELAQTVSLDTLLERNIYGHNLAVEKGSFLKIAGHIMTSSFSSARHSALMETAAFSLGHIPLPLVSIDRQLTQRREHCQEAISRFINRSTFAGRASVWSPCSERSRIRWTPPDEDIQVIIPSRNNPSDVIDITGSLQNLAKKRGKLHITIIDNCGEPETKRALAGLKSPNIDILEVDEAFNWSRFNNLAVARTSAPILVFANDDMRMITSEWDEIIRGQLSRQEIGALGVRLLYPDDTVQHAGILLRSDGTTIHDGLFEDSAGAGPNHRWQVTRNVAAVTGAFLATRRKVFDQVAGFDEFHLPIGFSDIDYALKLRSRGYRILWTPEISLYHFESKTRGYDHLSQEKQARNKSEQAIMFKRWGEWVTIDPGINPFWQQTPIPFRLISLPSAHRIIDYVRHSSKPNPWLVEV